MRLPLALALLSTSWLYGQGTPPKEKPADYPAHATFGAMALGAEYLVHSIPAGTQTFVAPEYLVIEVAVFPGASEQVEIGGSTFALRLNGKKQAFYPVSAGFVAASIKYPDWEQRRSVRVAAGAGDAGVIVGQPPVVGRFPNDPRPGMSRLPRAPKAPQPDDRSGVEREEPARAEDAIPQLALPEGAAAKPVSGFLYFPYKGKTRSIKSVDLVFESKAGPATLKLL